MIAETICYWCICTVLQNQLLDCTRKKSGSRADLSNAVALMHNKGELLTAECVEDGQKPEVVLENK